MKVIVAGTVVAEAERQELVRIEGNEYFPPSAMVEGHFKVSATQYTCPWKGAARYYDVVVDEKVASDAAWCYPEPIASAAGRVGKDFAGYVAFDRRQVEFVE